MRILVTGGLGNLGTYTLQELVRQGFEVRSFDLPSSRNKRKARAMNRAIDWMWGDIRDWDKIANVLDGVEVVVHLASVIPPLAHDRPDVAEAVNVGGTRNLLIEAAQRNSPPRVLFASTFDVFGPTNHLSPPRTVTDPLIPTDNYSQHKIQCEQEIQTAGVPWAIFRFATMPILGIQPTHPIMFEIPLDTRIEVLHPADAARAICSGIRNGAIWGKIWLIGGGPACQITYRTYLSRLLGVLGIPMLPEAAFGSIPYCTDWLDTTESQAVLYYQHHTFDAIVADISRGVGNVRHLVPLVRPLIIWSILRQSRYFHLNPAVSDTSAVGRSQ
jgi:UDP-glucose 4-epimerase